MLFITMKGESYTVFLSMAASLICVNCLHLQLFDLIYREETLFNVIKSVTRNGRSILLTALLALILVYLFSIVGFLFLKDDFIMEVDRLPKGELEGDRLILNVQYSSA